MCGQKVASFFGTVSTRSPYGILLKGETSHTRYHERTSEKSIIQNARVVYVD